MTITALLALSLLCIGTVSAQDEPLPVIACNLHAIASARRPRYNDLTRRLRSAIRDQQEIGNGFRYILDAEAIALTDVAEWISMERLCCPFLTLQLSTTGHESDWQLTLSGPPGVKALLREEFPTAHRLG